MLLGTYYQGVEIHREDKVIYARLLAPHRVLSTCGAAGGMRDDLDYLYNHQSCEPHGHERPSHGWAWSDPERYRRMTCQRYGLPDDRCAGLGTAADMLHASIKVERFRDLEVVAVCTGGVETNAGRAGDPAVVYETGGTFERTDGSRFVENGTINTLLFINRELTPGAMVRAVITATEAKSACLQELAVPSRYSDGLATGTGTDQIGIAALLNTGIPLTCSGKHCVLGELIGKTVHDAVCETLMLQNRLTPAGQCSAVVHLERFGATERVLVEQIASHLSDSDGALLRQNFAEMERNPLVVAAVAALVHLRDKVVWGTLPPGCVPELWAAYGAQLAAAVSGNVSRTGAYHRILAAAMHPFTNDGLITLTAHSLAVGFREKWSDTLIEEDPHER
ncbi:MAG: adenosylcobinamide amidohydrolase [Deltaproteobacteria bacterium]|nr:adenosylcobinamide amidohydrolase [Deltaproteobacteria bacterium]